MKGSSFQPHLLYVARIAASLSQRQLSSMLGIAQNTLSRWEAGIREPQIEDIERIAKVLERPLAFFFRAERPIPVDSAFMFHRKRARTKQSTLDTLHARINIARLAITPMLSQIASWEPRFHRMPVDEHGSAAMVARRLRYAWQVGRGPIRNLIELVESAGAIVISFDFGTADIDAVGWWPWDTPPLFFLNSLAPPDRLRFSLAHELGHLTMHEVPTESMEQEADEFAGEFLVPSESVQTEMQDVTTPTLWHLKRRWRVSAQCLIRRAFDAGVIDKSRYTSLCVYFSSKGWRKVEPVSIDAETPTTLDRIVSVFRGELGYSLNELQDLTGLTNDEVEVLLGVHPVAPSLRLYPDSGADDQGIRRRPR